TAWRGTHEPHVWKVLVDEVIVFVALVERAHGHRILPSIAILLLDFGNLAVDSLLTVNLRHRVVHDVEYALGNIVHAHEETHGKLFRLQFLLFRGSPEPICEVIVMRRGQLGDGTVATMMVGKDETLTGNNLGSTPSSKLHDGIFYTRMVNAIDFFGGELQAHFLHIALI